jgi:hypothetical protein
MNVKQNENILYQLAKNKQLFPAAKILSLDNKKNYFPLYKSFKKKSLKANLLQQLI